MQKLKGDNLPSWAFSRLTRILFGSAVALSIFFLFFFGVFSISSNAGDPPHNEASGVGCADCHGQSLLNNQSPFYTDNKADTAYNSICTGVCHNNETVGYGTDNEYDGPIAPMVKSHVLDGTAIKCTTCHHNHDQDQIYSGKNNKNKFFVAMGTVTNIPASFNYNSGTNRTTITYDTLAATDVSSKWADLTLLAKKTGDGRGALLVPNHTSRKRWPVYIIKVIDTGAKTITVKGNVTSASRIGIFFGQSIRRSVNYDSVPGMPKAVKFYDNQGDDSFTSTSNSMGVCQVCHSQTDHWSSDAPPGDKHFGSLECQECHPHDQGLKPVPPDHDPLVTVPTFCQECHNDTIYNFHNASEAGWVNCTKCHDKNNNYSLIGFLPLYLDPLTTWDTKKEKDIISSGQTSCDECHRGQYQEHVNDTGHGEVHDKVGADKEMCLACHFNNVVEEHVTRRDFSCLHCHGRTEVGKFDIAEVSQAVTDGRAGTTIYCSTCHNVSYFMTGGNSTYVDEHHVTSYAIDGDCRECHVVGRGIDGPVGGPCGSCHGDSRYGSTEYSSAMQHANAAMLNLDNVQDYRACFSCHLVGAQGYVADPEGDPPGDPGYTGTPLAEPMHALEPVNPRYPGDPWYESQIADLPACDTAIDWPTNGGQCDNYMIMAADPVDYISNNGGLSQAQKDAIFTLSLETPGYGLFDKIFAENFGLGGIRSYRGIYLSAGLDQWLRPNVGRVPDWQHLDSGSTPMVRISYDDGGGMQDYEVFSPDSTGGGGMVAGSGNISVSISPQGVIDAGARWRRDGLSWQNSGTVANELSPRIYQVDFQKISGWVTPEPVSVTVRNASTTTVSGIPAIYVACSEVPELAITGSSSLTWNDPDQVETYNISGWHGHDIKWSLSAGGATGFSMEKLSATTARIKKTGSTVAGSYTFSVTASGSDCYGNSVSLSVPVTVTAGGAPSPDALNQDGEIGNAVLDDFVLASSPAELIHVGGDMYARVAGNGLVTTFTISETGTMSATAAPDVDLVFSSQHEGTEASQWYKYKPDILNVSGNVYVIAVGGYLKTISINPTTGIITNLNKELTLDAIPSGSDIFHARDDIYIVIHTWWGKTYYMRTVQILPNGDMNYISGPWNFDSYPNFGSYYGVFDVVPVGDNIYAMTQIGTLFAPSQPRPGFIRTFALNSSGKILTSFIDTYEFDNVELSYLRLFNLDDNNNYGILYRNDYNDAAIKTIKIYSDGSIGQSINTMLLEQMYSVSGTDYIQISDEVFAFVGAKCYDGDAEDCPTMVETYRIKEGRIESQAIDYFYFGRAGSQWGKFTDVIHVSGDVYAVDNGGGEIFTITITNDGDGDGVLSFEDNCPAVANPGQEDADGDSIGDACDSYPNDPDNDSDGDGLAANLDPCPSDADNDKDGDGYCMGNGYNGSQTGENDNCPNTSNPDQADGDGDGVGDSCDNCLDAPNTDQSDVNFDGFGDVCDDNADNDAILDDGDNNGTQGDNPCTGGVTSNCDDNCPLIVNDNQVDVDADGIGDACDGVISTLPYTYRRTISLFPDTPLSDYQVQVVLTPENFDYVNAKADGSDIRFYDDVENELSYWTENWSSGGTSTLWVKVPASGTNWIYMAYGYGAATSASNGDATFLFFDDFEGSALNLTKWPQHRGEVISGSIITLDNYTSYVGPEDYLYASNFIVPIDSITELKHSAASSTTTSRFGITDQRTTFNQDNINYFGIQLSSGIPAYSQGLLFLGTNNGGTATNIESRVNDYTWHINKLIWSTDLAEFYIDDVLKLKDTTNVPTGTDTLHPLLRDVSATDWIRIRKFVSTEPVAVVGDERQ